MGVWYRPTSDSLTDDLSQVTHKDQCSYQEFECHSGVFRLELHARAYLCVRGEKFPHPEIHKGDQHS